MYNVEASGEPVMPRDFDDGLTDMAVRSEIKSARPIGRPPVKQRKIVTELRRQIVSGAIAPSGRMATREKLCLEYEASSVTVQQALDQLMAEGFAVARGTLGTFVADRPPHLSRYIIVVAFTPQSDQYTRFWTAMDNEARRLRRDGKFDIQIRHGVENHLDNEPFQRLLADVKYHRLAGLIFLHAPFYYRHTPLLDGAGIPRVAFMEPISGYPSVQAVHTLYTAVIERGLDYLSSRGRRRVAMIMNQYLPTGGVAWLEKAVADRGMFMEPHWMQFVHSGMSLSASHCAQLLMHRNQTVRPDGLIIADDNLVEATSAGLVRAGVRVPEDLEVVAHCNFPWPTPSVLPVKRLGFDARRVLHECIQSIDAQRRDKRIEAPILVPAVFEEELPD